MAVRPKPSVTTRLKVPVAGVVGLATSITLSELFADFVKRTLGYTGWYGVGVKAAFKTVFGLLLYGLSTVAGGLLSFALEVGSYGSFAMIVPDVVTALYPGGIPGLAESAAASVRGATVGAEKIRAELEKAEAGLAEREVVATA